MLARIFMGLALALLALPGAARAQAVVSGGYSSPERDARIDAQFAVATDKLRAAAAEALGPGAKLDAPPTVMVRKSITALTAAEVTSLRRGIAQMIAWNSAPHGSANYKRSLTYWANIHSFAGVNNQCSPASGLSNPGMSGLSLQHATTPDELATWCTCQHGTIQFLTWHRMYLYYFEQVLRAASGDPNLTLPFWDYETNGQIPTAYRTATYVDGGVTKANPLYVANRQAQLASGGSLSSSVVSTSNAMSKTTYALFNSTLEGTPHGSVHCATGVQSCPSGYMGYVPSAGNDPIFYSHHGNIDRLYECWLRVSPNTRLPSGAMLGQQFSFIDGTGALVTRTVGDMLTTAQLNYRYTAGGGCPPTLVRLPPIFLQLDRPFRAFPLLVQEGGIKLEAGTTRVPLRIEDETLKALAAPAPGEEKREPQAVVVLDGLSYDALPGVMYEVYVQNAKGKRVLLGVINFFTATATHGGLDRGDGMKGMEAMEHGAAPLSFDASEALKTLGGAKGATLVIEPTTGIKGSTPAEAAKGINPKANVRFSAVRVELF